MGSVIHRELSKKLKFDHTNKWCMHNQASVLENGTHKLLWDSEIETDHLISARWTDVAMKKQKQKQNKTKNFAVPADHTVKLKESKKKRISTSTLLGNWKKLWNMKVTVLQIVIGTLGIVIKRLVQGLEDREIKRRVETIQTKASLR